MIEVQDRMILLSGQTAKRFQQNVLHPPKNPARDQLFAELDAMQVVERTTKRLTIELPGFSPSFLHKEGGGYMILVVKAAHRIYSEKTQQKFFKICC